jgi:hypothetical protein
MDFIRKMTGTNRRRSTRRRSQSSRVFEMTSATGSQLRALENTISRGPLTLVLVYSPSCPHCHTYMPMWKDLCRTSGRRANLVSMKADVYDKTPLSEQKTVTGVPSVLYVDDEGRVTEADDIRNQPLMKNVVKTASPEPEAAAAAPEPEAEMEVPATPASNLFRSEPEPEPEEIAPIVPVQPPAMPIAGSEFRENPLEPLPATPVQQGGSLWSAFLMSAARQAAPAAVLLGAYAALPKRSSGLPAARRRRTSSRRRQTRRRNRQNHQ